MSFNDVALKLKLASTRSFTRTAALIGIVLAVAGPFLLLTIGGREANNLPWYVWTMIPLLFLAVVSFGFLKFKRKSREGEDISINPSQRQK
jgi:hypothetical protein